jgi:ABC-type transporter Mla subunit MlaD
MSRERRDTSVIASPVLVGTITALVSVIAVFLSYNANSGLPFVPTYKVAVYVPDAAGLVAGNEVRVGGKRVGVVEKLEARELEGREPVAKLELELEKRAEPILDDSRVTVRPRSPLGLKYVELVPGTRGEPVPADGELALARAQPVVDLDEVINAFDAETRRSLQRALGGLGTGLAGRGADLNSALAELPLLLSRAELVAENLSDPRTGLRRLVRGLDRTAGELARVSPELGSLIEAADVTARALAGVRVELAESVAELPATELAGIRALRTARPVLDDAAALARDIRPGTRLLPLAARRLDSALDAGTPVLRRAVALAGRLRDSLEAVDELARDPLTGQALDGLLATVESAYPTLRYLVPFQTTCNYIGLWTRNVPSTISEGDTSGTWFRTLVIQKQQPDEASPQAEPAPDLHANPYSRSDAPGHDGECEAGNEVYEPGRRIGEVPGRQPGRTEATAPPEGVGEP